MKQPSPAATGLPRIVLLVSHLQRPDTPSQLAQLARQLLPAYAAQAHVEVIDIALADALDLALDLEKNARADVFIGTGATAAYLRQHVASPVLSLRVGGRDLLRALDRARQLTSRVAILSYPHVSAELERMGPLFTVQLRQCSYGTLAEAQDAIAQLAGEGVGAIIGSSLVVELAARAGVHGILALSGDAVREALDDALAICRSQRIEQARREQLNAVLHHLSEGVVALDRDGLVRSINPAMARLLDIPAGQAPGRALAELAPDLDGHIGAQDRIVRLGRRTVVANALPVFEHGERSGVVITCQEIHAVQRADRHIRSSTRPSHHVARYRLEQIAGDSEPLRALIALARRYAASDSTVLVTGESGTGKELLAQGIHSAGARQRGPFVPINCAAFPETLLESELFGHEEGAFSGARKGGKMGLFEAAHGGTVFLDEIGDMPLPLQTRLLRVLQEREVLRLGATEATPIDVRVIAATHCDLRARIADGRFREDLYYRINILRLEVPPLRARGADIVPVARAILQRIAAPAPLHARQEALLMALQPYLLAYRWPGNVRELENALERMLLSVAELCSDGDSGIDPVCLRRLMPEWFEGSPQSTPHAAPMPLPQPVPALAADGTPLRATRRASETAHIRAVLGACGGSVQLAAERLGVSRSTLWRRLRAPDGN
jgi:propionate catabolism operon transcriptional regulator